jgi:hypothetical protein
VLPYQRHCLALARHDERPGAAHDFAGDNHDLALAGLHIGSSAVDSLRLPIRRLRMAAGIHAVDFDGVIGTELSVQWRYLRQARMQRPLHVDQLVILEDAHGGAI